MTTFSFVQFSLVLGLSAHVTLGQPMLAFIPNSYQQPQYQQQYQQPHNQPPMGMPQQMGNFNPPFAYGGGAPGGGMGYVPSMPIVSRIQSFMNQFPQEPLPDPSTANYPAPFYGGQPQPQPQQPSDFTSVNYTDQQDQLKEMMPNYSSMAPNDELFVPIDEPPVSQQQQKQQQQPRQGQLPALCYSSIQIRAPATQQCQLKKEPRYYFDPISSTCLEQLVCPRWSSSFGWTTDRENSFDTRYLCQISCEQPLMRTDTKQGEQVKANNNEKLIIYRSMPQNIVDSQPSAKDDPYLLSELPPPYF